VAEEDDRLALALQGSGDRRRIAAKRDLFDRRRIVAPAGKIDRDRALTALRKFGDQLAEAPAPVKSPMHQDEGGHPRPPHALANRAGENGRGSATVGPPTILS